MKNEKPVNPEKERETELFRTVFNSDAGRRVLKIIGRICQESKSGITRNGRGVDASQLIVMASRRDVFLQINKIIEGVKKNVE